MRLVAQAVVLATLAFIGACGDSNAPIPPPTDANVVGTYHLTGVNGGPLPFPYSQTVTSRFEIVGGSLTLAADHTFIDAFTTREVLLAGGSRPDRTDTREGTWVLEINNLTLTYPGLGTQVAFVTANLISLNDQGLALAYRK